MYNDLRYGFHMLLKNPGFTAVAVLTLALGIGGATAIFSVVQCAVLDPFPYADSHRLAVLVYDDITQGRLGGWAAVSAPEFMDYQEQNHVFDEVVGSSYDYILMTGTQDPTYLIAFRLTANAFRILGVPPLIGRPLTPEDTRLGAPPVAVLSYKVWQNKFGRDPGIVGRTVILNDRPTTVVGVVARRFGWHGADLYLPATPSRGKATDQQQYFSILGHLKPRVSIEQAAADVAVLAKRFAAIYPKDHPKGVTFSIHSLVKASASEAFRSSAYIVLGAVGLLLLIACANTANLLLARATAREQEFAVRAALGASRFRLARQLMIESLLLALGGAALGCLLTWNGLEKLVVFTPLQYWIPAEAEIRINGSVLLFALVTALLSTLLFGLAPAMQVARKDLQEPLKASSKGGGESLRHNRLRNLLVVSEVALSMILLCGSALLMRSFFALHRVEIGFDPDHVLLGGVTLPEKQYKTIDERIHFHLELLRSLRALPGAVSAALINPAVDRGRETHIEIAAKASGESQRAFYCYASDRYFETMRIRLLQGRSIFEQDLTRARNVAVVNESFTKEYLKGENPLGQRIKVAELETGPLAVKPPWFEVVGVIADVRDLGPEVLVAPEIYIPYTVGGVPFVSFVIRTGVAPVSMVKSVRHAIWSMDKELPVELEAKTVREYKDLGWFSGYRFELMILVVFALLGLTLVSIGVYSILSYVVSRRTHEIGVRMALGAQATDVHRMVMVSGLRWLLVGIGIGVPTSIALAKILQNRIWGIKSADPLTLAAVALLLTAVGLAACYIPARRATKVDPMVALRYE